MRTSNGGESVDNGQRDPLIYPIRGMTLRPDGMPLMVGAYIGLLKYLLTQEWAIAQFKVDTGLDISRVLMAGGITKMVDRSTGYDVAVVGAFADWVTRTQWGEEGAEDAHK